MLETYVTKNEYIDYILQTYSNMIFRLAISITKSKDNSEDIMQEVFMRYIKKNPDFANKEHEKAWFLRVTINCSKKLMYSAWNRHTVELGEDFKFEDKEIDEIYSIVLKLPKKYRETIHLFYYEDLSINKISEILNEKEGTIKSRLSRARDMLKNMMKGGKWDEE